MTNRLDHVWICWPLTLGGFEHSTVPVSAILEFGAESPLIQFKPIETIGISAQTLSLTFLLAH